MASLTLSPGALNQQPSKLRIIAETRSWLAVEKPAGLVGIREGWASSRSFSLADALREEWQKERSPLHDLGWDGIFPLCSGDPEGPGFLLLAKSIDARDSLKNAMGAGQWEFRHQWITTRRDDLPETLHCDLPLARHRHEPRMLVSHRSGKKTTTTFHRLAQSRYFSLWEAVSPYHRPHQFRLHALECGLVIPGDSLYHPETPVPGELLRLIPPPQRHRFHPWRQSCLTLADEEVIKVPPPPGWAKLLKSF